MMMMVVMMMVMMINLLFFLRGQRPFWPKYDRVPMIDLDAA